MLRISQPKKSRLSGNLPSRSIGLHRRLLEWVFIRVGQEIDHGAVFELETPF